MTLTCFSLAEQDVTRWRLKSDYKFLISCRGRPSPPFVEEKTSSAIKLVWLSARRQLVASELQLSALVRRNLSTSHS